tara:strand:- start:176 stop:337 length:162 start_codon:yes stop_codon:yes gene_type:complete
MYFFHFLVFKAFGLPFSFGILTTTATAAVTATSSSKLVTVAVAGYAASAFVAG